LIYILTQKKMYRDEKGNRLFWIEKPKAIHYYLHLNGELHQRKLWVLKEDWVLYMNRDREEHLFIKNNSYGFNEYFLKNVLNPNVEIIIKEKWRKLRLKTTVWKIFEEWQYLHFLSQGFEKQIFLKLELFEVIL